jgi:hypothetical protein
MAYTLQETINWAQTYIEYSPLTAGTNFEPALSIGTMVRSTILNAPLVWPWNRDEYLINAPNTPASLIAGVQDYTFPITDFAYLEKISLLSADGTYGYEIQDVHNTNILGIAGTNAGAQAQPNSAAVKFYTPGTSVSLRFLSVPDQAYTGVITYQQLALPFTTLAGLWAPIPDSFMDIFNNLFLAEAMEAVDDARGQYYRQRGIAALLAKSEGLSQMQINAFLAQWTARGVSQQTSAQLRTQQASQARGV